MTLAKAEQHPLAVPHHIAIIMDGNGRWAADRHLPRQAGHRAGMETVKRTVRAASDIGVGYLTLFGFSAENWKRPQLEVNYLMDLMRIFMRRELDELNANNVRMTFVGEREGLARDISALLDEATEKTKNNTGLNLRIAFNYGGQQEILDGVEHLLDDVAEGRISVSEIDEQAIDARLWSAGTPDPELVIRTSGEQRLSNFLLWQASRAELVFIDKRWPDFGADDLMAAINTYRSRVESRVLT
ncbi:MAG: isoprenyl transferase [Alphaproteobacteria bacterium]